jgi:probable rRNA maturation factor
VSSPDIVLFVEAGDWPAEAELEDLARRAIGAAEAALSQDMWGHPSPSPSPQGGGEPQRELSIVFTDDAAMRKLNEKWRGKDSSTNVLSFPQTSSHNPGGLLGDVILSAETVAREASLADKRLEDHMAHLIIHGYLHLLGFDHEAEAEAEKMEQLERVALRTLGIPDPYATASGE